jgi:hypothetical protein
MFFKRKKTEQKTQYNVFFKKQPYHKEYAKRRVNKKQILYKKSPIKELRCRNNPRVQKVKKLHIRNKVLSLLLVVVLGFIVLVAGYSVYKFITTLRGGTTIDNIDYLKTFVEGVPSVPIYPQSEFVYKDRREEEIVLKMLNQGISAYRLPRGTKSSDVYEYYEEQLPQKDWIYVSTVHISTEDKLFGQYWIKEEKGLRIFVENNDVWYETITKVEANNSLSDRRAQEIQRKRILESSAEQKLLPDFPWQMEIPREYLTRYSSTNIEELQAVEIFEIGSEKTFLIYPIGKSDEGNYDQMLHSFLNMKSEETESKWSIINTRIDYFRDREVLMANLLIEENEGEGAVFINKRNFHIYAIIANRVGEEFFEYILSNLQDY